MARLALLHLPRNRHRDPRAVRGQPEPSARLHRSRLVRPRRLFRHRRLYVRDPDEDVRRAFRARAHRRRPRTLPPGRSCSAHSACARPRSISRCSRSPSRKSSGRCASSGIRSPAASRASATSPIPSMDWMDALPLLDGLRSGDKFYLIVLVLTGRCLRAAPARRRLAVRPRADGDPREPRARRVRRDQRAALPARSIRDGGRLRGFRRRAVRHLQSRGLPRLRLLGEVGRSPDHGDPRRHGAFLGPGGRRGRTDRCSTSRSPPTRSTGRSSSARS